MIDQRERFERAFGLFEMPEPAIDRLFRRRERKQRYRQIAAGAVALVLAAAVAVGLLGALSLDRSTPADEPPPPTDGDAARLAPASIGTATLAQNGCELEPAGGSVDAGLVELVVVNEGDAPGAFDLVRFEPKELSYEEFAAHIAKQRRRAEAGKPPSDGGVGPFRTLGLPRFAGVLIHEQVGKGRSERMTGTVYPGLYAIVCFRTFDGASDLRPVSIDGPIQVR
jgi:hypothetical protein